MDTIPKKITFNLNDSLFGILKRDGTIESPSSYRASQIIKNQARAVESQMYIDPSRQDEILAEMALRHQMSKAEDAYQKNNKKKTRGVRNLFAKKVKTPMELLTLKDKQLPLEEDVGSCDICDRKLIPGEYVFYVNLADYGASKSTTKVCDPCFGKLAEDILSRRDMFA